MASGGVKVTALAPAKPTVVAPVVAPPAIPAAHFFHPRSDDFSCACTNSLSFSS